MINLQGTHLAIGRNEICPCGSGKRYKKCCGALLEISEKASAGLRELGGLAPQESELNTLENFYRSNRHEECEAYAGKLLERFPNSAALWHLLARCRTAMGTLDIGSLRNAASLAPNELGIHLDLASAYTALAKYSDAIESLTCAIAIDPNHLRARFERCALLAYMGDFESAWAGAEDLGRIAPDSVELAMARSRIYFQSGIFDRAVEMHRDVMRRSPQTRSDLPMDSIQQHIARVAPEKERLFYAGMVAEAESLAADEFRRLPTVENHNFLLMCIHANPERRAADYFDEARRWAALHGKEDLLPLPSSFRNNRSRNRTLKVAFLGDYFSHAIPVHTLVPFFQQYDRAQLEVYVFNYGNCIGDIRLLVDHWIDINGISGEEFFRLVRDCEIDIFLDINGRLKNPTYFSTLLLQPAPIQVNWFNLTATVGHRAYNYLIADHYSIREGEERYYTEKIYKMPTGTISSWDMGESPPPNPAPPCLANDFVTFASFGDFFKVNRHVIRAWAMLLQRVPKSRLFLKGGYLQIGQNRQRLERDFAEFGISRDRLWFEGISEYRIMKIRYNAVDIALDTFPYSGGSTTINALWQGVPVVTVSGDSWRERNGASILAGANLYELIASDVENYIEIATALANDRSRLIKYRQNLRATLLGSPQWQTREFARNFEGLLREMWFDWLDHSQPAS